MASQHLEFPVEAGDPVVRHRKAELWEGVNFRPKKKKKMMCPKIVLVAL